MAAVGGHPDSNNYDSMEFADNYYNNNELETNNPDDSSTAGNVRLLLRPPSLNDDEAPSMMDPTIRGNNFFGRRTRTTEYDNPIPSLSQSVVSCYQHCNECFRAGCRWSYDLVVDIRSLDVIFAVVLIVMFVVFSALFIAIFGKLGHLEKNDERLENSIKQIFNILNTTHGETVGAHHG
mmetsp:Transcript_14614/g.21050  ORF Transcript_14614/g.21050 Transcript_14614/m.21050 type:complete len:179 (-) Transcript_14614:63-599(-)